MSFRSYFEKEKSFKSSFTIPWPSQVTEKARMSKSRRFDVKNYFTLAGNEIFIYGNRAVFQFKLRKFKKY